MICNRNIKCAAVFRSAFTLFIRMLFQKMNDEWNTDQSCNDIRHRLGKLHTGKLDQRDSNQQEGDRNRTGANQGENRGDRGFLNTLIQHCNWDGKRHKQHSDCGITQRRDTDPNYIRMLLEQTDDGFSGKDTDNGDQSDKAEVNSYHGQCVDDVAPGFRVTARTEDGVIEAIEKDNIVGVQWHPEVAYEMEFFKQFLKTFFTQEQLKSTKL